MNNKEANETNILSKKEEENLKTCDKEFAQGMDANTINDYTKHIGDGLGMLWSIACQRSGFLNFFKSKKKGMKMVKNLISNFSKIKLKQNTGKNIEEYESLCSKLYKSTENNKTALRNLIAMKSRLGDKLIELSVAEACKGDDVGLKTDAENYLLSLNGITGARDRNEDNWKKQNEKNKNWKGLRVKIKNIMANTILSIQERLKKQKGIYDSNFKKI